MPFLPNNLLNCLKIGEDIVSLEPVFSTDSKYIFVCSGSKIKIISTKTGFVVNTLENKKEVSGVRLSPINPLQLYVWSESGYINLWDYEDGNLLKTYELGLPILHLEVDKGSTNQILFLSYYQKIVDGQVKNTNRQQVLLYSVTLPKLSGKITSLKVQTRIQGKVDNFYLSGRGDFVAFISGKQLFVWNRIQYNMKIFKNNHRLTCLAIHPQKGFIATGDYIGVIKIWYFNKETQKPLNSELHWHSHGVNTITFTSDGEYLLSGGNESVLVVWQLQTGAKNFLPRLGSEILWIRVSPDEKYFLLACGDNTVRLVSSLTLATLNITHGPVFSGPAARSSFPLLTVNPRRGYLLLPAMPGYLQFYDIVSDKHVDTLAVSPRNFYLAMQKSTRLSKTVIEHAVFSWDASRLATVERCDNGKLGNELQLKFWTYEVAVSRFVLNTCADSPHEINVTCLVYHPAKHVVVTTGSDKKFKVWAQCTITKDSTATTFKGEEGQTIPNNKDIYYWSCRNVGAYRGQPPTYADFCHDGSLLAVAYGKSITLWDSDLNTLKGSFCYVPPGQTIRQLKFIRAAPYIVSITESMCYVWNLLTCSVWWSCELHATRLISSFQNSAFAVSAYISPSKRELGQKIILFSPASPAPLSTLEVYNDLILNLTFLEYDNTKSLRLVVITEKERNIYLVTIKSSPEDSVVNTEFPKSVLQNSINLVDSNNLDFLLCGNNSNNNNYDDNNTNHTKKKSWTGVFNAPSHLLPPIRQLFPHFVSNLLQCTKDSTKSQSIQDFSNFQMPTAPTWVPTKAVLDEVTNHNLSLRAPIDFNFLANVFAQIELKPKDAESNLRGYKYKLLADKHPSKEEIIYKHTNGIVKINDKVETPSVTQKEIFKRKVKKSSKLNSYKNTNQELTLNGITAVDSAGKRAATVPTTKLIAKTRKIVKDNNNSLT